MLETSHRGHLPFRIGRCLAQRDWCCQPVNPHFVMYGRPPLGKDFFGVSANGSGSGHVYGLEMRPLTAGPDGDRRSNSNHCDAL